MLFAERLGYWDRSVTSCQSCRSSGSSLYDQWFRRIVSPIHRRRVPRPGTASAAVHTSQPEMLHLLSLRNDKRSRNAQHLESVICDKQRLHISAMHLKHMHPNHLDEITSALIPRRLSRCSSSHENGAW